MLAENVLLAMESSKLELLQEVQIDLFQWVVRRTGSPR
jgi:hypothetical protein